MRHLWRLYFLFFFCISICISLWGVTVRYIAFHCVTVALHALIAAIFAFQLELFPVDDRLSVQGKTGHGLPDCGNVLRVYAKGVPSHLIVPAF